uniref:Exportin-T n=1 Tax=Fibrocapsa japonica TaxID=94617 RepID=A0A7S2UVH7_9STRA
MRCVSAAVEAYGGGAVAGSPNARVPAATEYFAQAMAFLTQSTIAHLHQWAAHPTSPTSARRGEALAAYFELVHRCLLFAPAALLMARDQSGSPEKEDQARVRALSGGEVVAGQALQMAVAAFCDTDRDAARAAIVFTTQLLGRCDGVLNPHAVQVQVVVLAAGPALAQALVGALVSPPVSSSSSTTPAAPGATGGAHPQLRPHVATCLHRLVSAFTSNPEIHGVDRNTMIQHCHQWVEASFSSSSVLCEKLDQDRRRQVLDRLFQLVSSQIRFKSLALDVSKVCHGEMVPDDLLSHFM